MQIKLIYIIILLASKVPLRILYVLSNIIYFFNKIFIKYRIEIIKKNIKNSYTQLDKKAIDLLIKQFYKSFFNNIIEIIKAIRFSKNDIIEKIKIKNIDSIEESIRANKSIVLIGSHYGNWEWVVLRIGLINNIKLHAVYKPLSNYHLDQILLRLRRKFGTNLITLNKWKYFIMKKKHSRSTFMFIADQVPDATKNGIRLNFLNQSTLFYEGAEKTAKLLNADVFYVDCEKIKKGHYLVSFKKIIAHRITKEYTTLLENTINNNPPNWLWSHNRWKR
mgnify:CR=1 FL=1|tara:strand:- start:1305 stop:2135 length:831 start_codon:yes stop_codon:yes gene_type:complete